MGECVCFLIVIIRKILLKRKLLVISPVHPVLETIIAAAAIAVVRDREPQASWCNRSYGTCWSKRVSRCDWSYGTKRMPGSSRPCRSYGPQGEPGMPGVMGQPEKPAPPERQAQPAQTGPAGATGPTGLAEQQAQPVQPERQAQPVLSEQTARLVQPAQRQLRQRQCRCYWYRGCCDTAKYTSGKSSRCRNSAILAHV